MVSTDGGDNYDTYCQTIQSDIYSSKSDSGKKFGGIIPGLDGEPAFADMSNLGRGAISYFILKGYLPEEVIKAIFQNLVHSCSSTNYKYEKP